MNICVQGFVFTQIFISLGYTPRNRMVRSNLNSVFNHLRNCQTVSQSSWVILHSHQQCMREFSHTTFLPPHQHFLLSVFPETVILVRESSISLWFWFALPWCLVMLDIFSGAYFWWQLLSEKVLFLRKSSQGAKVVGLRNIRVFVPLFHSGHRIITSLYSFLPSCLS